MDEPKKILQVVENTNVKSELFKIKLKVTYVIIFDQLKEYNKIDTLVLNFSSVTKLFINV